MDTYSAVQIKVGVVVVGVVKGARDVCVNVVAGETRENGIWLVVLEEARMVDDGNKEFDQEAEMKDRLTAELVEGVLWLTLLEAVATIVPLVKE